MRVPFEGKLMLKRFTADTITVTVDYYRSRKSTDVRLAQ